MPIYLFYFSGSLSEKRFLFTSTGKGRLNGLLWEFSPVKPPGYVAQEFYILFSLFPLVMLGLIFARHVTYTKVEIKGSGVEDHPQVCSQPGLHETQSKKQSSKHVCTHT